MTSFDAAVEQDDSVGGHCATLFALAVVCGKQEMGVLDDLNHNPRIKRTIKATSVLRS